MGRNIWGNYLKPLESGITFRIMFLIVGLSLIIGLAMGVYLHFMQTETLTRELQNKGDFFSRYLAEKSTEHLLLDDEAGLQQLIENTKISESDIAYIYIHGNKNEIIVDTFENEVPSALKEIETVDSNVRIIQLDNVGGYVRDISQPIPLEASGEVHVGMSETNIRNTVSRSAQLSAGFVVLLLFVGSAISFWTGKIISGQLAALKQCAGEFEKRNFKPSINIKTNGELGNLTNTFNKMAETIEHHALEKEKANRELSETRSYLDAVLGASIDGILILDSKGYIEYVNEAFLKISGYEKSDVAGRNLMTIIKDEVFNFTGIHWENIKNGMIRNYETGMITSKGNLKDINISFMEAKISEKTNYVAIVKDISEMKKIDEISNNIISNVSHELRTPLTIVKGFIEVVLDEKDQEKRNEYLTISLNAIDRLNQMIDDLIETSLVQKNAIKLKLETLNLKDIIDFSVEDIRSKAGLSQIDITSQLKEDMNARIDAHHLSFALSKILDNAIKFNRKGGTIEINVEGSAQYFEVKIKDTGIGIAKENLDKIFDRFYQVDAASTRTYGGNGVGLTLAKHIIEAHGGKIWVESELGVGSTFHFTVQKNML